MTPRTFLPVCSPQFMRCVLVALAPLLASGFSHATGPDLDLLMHGLAQIRSGHAGFVEKKYIAMLDRPVESSGELFYRAPDRLEKRTLKPKPETMILENGTLLIERDRQKHVLQLRDYPELAAVIDSIRGTLAGDRQALERSYRLSMEGDAGRWTLQLLPIDEKMQAVIKQVRITGARYEVQSIEISHVDGDSSLMLIEKLTAR